jgi:cell division protein FtsL
MAERLMAGSRRSSAKKRGPGRRSILALVLLGFVLVATGVISRRVYGVAQAARLRALTRQHDELEAERIRLDAAIRDASSRGRLEPIAEQQLQMHIVPPDQIIYLPRARAGSSSVHP